MSFDHSHVPQANRPELVLRIAEMASTGPLSLSDIHDVLRAAGRGEFVERQALYYARAAELFGLVEISGSTYIATALAEDLQSTSNRQHRNQLLKSALFSNPLLVKIVEIFPSTRPSRQQISEFLQKSTSLAPATCERRASSILMFLDQWLFGGSEGKSSLNSREWSTVLTLDGHPLPEWAQFFLDLGRISALDSKPGLKTWRLVSVPHRNMVSALFSIGYLEASIPSVLASIDEFDIADLSFDDQITWKVTRDGSELAFGYFKHIDDKSVWLKSDMGPTFTHSRLSSGGSQQPTRRTLAMVKQFQFSEYFGNPFVNPRQMSRNKLFFSSFAGTRHEDLLCNSTKVVCLAGRPNLRDDLTSQEFKIGKTSGSADDLLRVRGVDDVNEVAHYLTDYISPDWEVTEVSTAMCAVFDGQLSYPKLKNYIDAVDNLLVLDRWDSGSVNSFNSFDVERATKGQPAKFRPDHLRLPIGIEYMEWSEPK